VKKSDDCNVKYELTKFGKTSEPNQIAESVQIAEPGLLVDDDTEQSNIPEQLIKTGNISKENVKTPEHKQPVKPGQFADIGTKGKEKKKVFNVIDNVGEDEYEEEDSSSDYVYESGSEESSAHQSEIDEAKEELPDLIEDSRQNDK
jgi:hypothetical protein